LSGGRKEDLVILFADKDAEQGVGCLIRARAAGLGIREITFKQAVHPKHDGGVFQKAEEFLRAFLRTHAYALAILDFEGCGQERRMSASEVERSIEGRLSSNGWDDRSAAIVIEPELEAWLWDPSLTVRSVLGSGIAEAVLRGSLGLIDGKPPRPKEVFQDLLRKHGVRRSSSLFALTASRIDFDHCQDRAFQKLRSTLRGWFPPQ